MYHFTHTILSRPDLAQHVRHLSLGRLYTLKESEKLKIHRDFLATCQGFINKIFMDWAGLVMRDELRKTWIDHFEDLLPGTFQSILVCALPNLETLYFQDDQPTVYIWQLFNAASRLDPNKVLNGRGAPRRVPFQKLHSIRRIANRLNSRECQYDNSSYFMLPSVVKLEFAHTRGLLRHTRGLPDVWNTSPRSSSVQYLSFQQSDLSINYLSSAINICAHLKEFHFTSERDQYFADFTSEDILVPLLSHAKSLEVLHLDVVLLTSRRPSDEKFFNSRLSGLKNLKHLILSYGMLFVRGHLGFSLSTTHSPANAQAVRLSDVLPPSLEALHLIGCGPNVVRHIQELDRARRSDNGKLAHLRLVKCAFDHDTVRPSKFEQMKILDVDVEALVHDDFNKTYLHHSNDVRASSALFADASWLTHPKQNC